MIYVGLVAAAIVAWSILACIVSLLICKCIHTDPPETEWSELEREDDIIDAA